MRKDMKVEYGESFLRVADPVVDGFIKASSTSVILPCAPVDGDVLISLEVNGTVVARRELFTMVEGSVDVGDYTVAYSGGAVTISTTSNNDVVSIRIEPVEVVVSDAFRAAVNETAPQTPNELPAVGSDDNGKYLHANESTGAVEWAEGGGDVFVVKCTNPTSFPAKADKPYSEILDAYNSGKTIAFKLNTSYSSLAEAYYNSGSPSKDFIARILQPSVAGKLQIFEAKLTNADAYSCTLYKEISYDA